VSVTIATSVEKPIYFYHSFPRLPRQNDHALGLRILDSILDKGLLLAAELRTFAACAGLTAAEFVQKRVCFTALTSEQLADHSRTFGSFSLEFDGGVVRDFGALPAVYFSGRLPTGEIFNTAGEGLARTLLEAHNVLGGLWNLCEQGPEDRKKVVTALLDEIHPSKIPIQILYFTLQALLNLYYPTDDPQRTVPLHYYQQREWKIVPNLSYRGQWHYPSPTPDESTRLIEINPGFFGEIILGKPRVEHCCFFTVDGKNVVDFVRRIIVPDEALDCAKRIATRRGRSFEVISLSAQRS
jgi:hypothetical protein